MSVAKDGNVVQVHYTGTLDDGQTFDSSREREPLEFTIGQGQMIPGFEKAVVGMAVGESKSVTIPSEEAYGPHRPEMTMKMEKDKFPDGVDPQVGMQFQVGSESGSTVMVTVAKVEDDGVTLDANHPLAGKDLTFEIEVMSIQ